MESRAKIFGHPVHPILIVLPLGLLATALGLDVAYALTHRTGLAVASYWNIGVGVVAGLVAAVFGAIDWFAISGGTRARTVGLWHGLGNAVVLTLFAVPGSREPTASCTSRRGSRSRSSSWAEDWPSSPAGSEASWSTGSEWVSTTAPTSTPRAPSPATTHARRGSDRLHAPKGPTRLQDEFSNQT